MVQVSKLVRPCVPISALRRYQKQRISATPRRPSCRESCTTKSTLPSQYLFTSSNPMPSPAAMTIIANRSMAFRAVSAWMTDAATRAEYRTEIGQEFTAYFDEAQAYLRCLDAARAAVSEEINRVIPDYQSLGPEPDG